MVESRSRQHRVRCRREAGNWIVGVALVARIPRDIGLASRVDRDRNGGFVAMSEEGRIHQAATVRAEFGQECALSVWAVACVIDHGSASRLVRALGNRKLGRGGKSGYVGAARAVDGNGVGFRRRVVEQDTPANISGVDQLRACRIQLGDEARGRVCGIDGLDRSLQREVSGLGVARHIYISRWIDNHTLRRIPAWAIGSVTNFVRLTSTQVGQIVQHRIDHQRAVVVILAQRKLNTVAGQLVIARDHFLLARDGLIDHRLPESERSAIEREHQTSVRAEHGPGARKFEPDLFRIRARRHDKIVFELALGSVIDQIDTRIDLLIVHSAKSADAVNPFVGIVAHEVVHNPGERISAGDLGVTVGSGQLHPHHGGRLALLKRAELEHGAVPG